MPGKDNIVAKTFVQRFDKQEITLAHHTLVSFHLEQIGEDGKNTGTATMKVETSCGDPIDGQDGSTYYPLTLIVNAAPSDGSSYYKCSITLKGSFGVSNELEIDEDQARIHVLTDGVNELYAIAKGYVAQITSNGAFGSFDLPSLKATGEVVED